MTTGASNLVIPHLRRLAVGAAGNSATDQQLLSQFIQQQDQAAFAALVRRHGPMVLRAARRVLSNLHDAEDVLQATFLTLARRAPSIRNRDSAASWLFGVAHRIALKIRTRAAQQHMREKSRRSATSQDPLAELTGTEMCRILHEELNQLPETCRGALILCLLEGKTRDEAAQQLGLSLGTLKRRLERGRNLLHQRLVRRGLALSTVLTAATVAEATASTALPIGVVATTVKAATLFASGKRVPGVVSARAVALAEGVSAMAATKLGPATLIAVFLTLAAIGLGVGAAMQQPAAQAKKTGDDRRNDEKPLASDVKAAGEKAALDALARFEKNWNPPKNSLRRLGDPGWKAKMEAIVALAKAGPTAEPVLLDAWQKGEHWSPWTRDFAAQVIGVVRPSTPVRKVYREYDLTKMDSARLGQPAPDFTLADISGKTYRLSDFRGKKAVVLVFIVEGFG